LALPSATFLWFARPKPLLFILRCVKPTNNREKLNWVEVPAADTAKARAFYGSLFGWGTSEFGGGYHVIANGRVRSCPARTTSRCSGHGKENAASTWTTSTDPNPTRSCWPH
jgi:hypothetical protein